MSANRRQRHTVKDLARLSGVSVRALRFYDQIGLLKPAFVGDNGYRYYEKKELLLLQQILFYRELGLELARIREILADPKFDKAAALRSHREQLVKQAERTQVLLETIDKTLAHLEKEVAMSDKEIYMGFDPEKQAAYEREIIERGGEAARERVSESHRRTRGWGAAEFNQVRNDFDSVHRRLAELLARGLTAGSAAVQVLVGEHYAIVDRFWTPDAAAYAGLGRMYVEHAEFRAMLDAYDPRLAEFLAEAMRFFAERELARS